MKPMNNIPCSFKLIDSMIVNGRPLQGSCWVYRPEFLHTYDNLSTFLNSVIFLYPDTPYRTTEEAWNATEELGLAAIAEEYAAYIAIPCPVSGSTYGAEDLEVNENIQSWLAGTDIHTPMIMGAGGGPDGPDGPSGPDGLDHGPGGPGPDRPAGPGGPDGEPEKPDGPNAQGPDAAGPMMPLRKEGAPNHVSGEHVYVIAEGAGAAFVNNYLSRHANRISAILTFDGDIAPALPVKHPAAAYLVRPSDRALSYWKAANQTDCCADHLYTCSSNDQQLVRVLSSDTKLNAEAVRYTWDTLFLKTEKMRLNSSTSPDDLGEVRSLMSWPNLKELGMTVRSIEFDPEREAAADLPHEQTVSPATVHIYAPEDLNLVKKYPLVLILHGGSGDPIEMVKSSGWCQLAAAEKLILIAPANETVPFNSALLNWVKANYPVDASRVYATGFSMGGLNTSNIGKAFPAQFAAIAPMGSCGGSYVPDYDSSWSLPVCMIIGSSDALNIRTGADGSRIAVGLEPRAVAQNFEINGIPYGTPDYLSGPYWGHPADEVYDQIIDGITYHISNYCNRTSAVPVVQGIVIDGIVHTYTDRMADLAWSFMKNFSR